MVKTTEMIVSELHQYASPLDKLSRLVKQEKYIPIIRGLYETDKTVSGYLLANIIYAPSYLSFEFALAYHGLIPEAVYSFTSATFEKKKKKIYENPFGTFTYQDIPSSAYYYGIEIKAEKQYTYFIASPEKALCDQLYKTKPVSNKKELIELIYEDLRIDEPELKRLNKNDIEVLSGKYRSTNVKKLSNFLRSL